MYVYVYQNLGVIHITFSPNIYSLATKNPISKKRIFFEWSFLVQSPSSLPNYNASWLTDILTPRIRTISQ